MCVKIQNFLIFPHMKIKKIFLPKKFLYKEISSFYENYDYFCNRKSLIKFQKRYKIPKFLPENGKIIIPILFQTPISRTDGFLPFRRS